MLPTVSTPANSGRSAVRGRSHSGRNVGSARCSASMWSIALGRRACFFKLVSRQPPVRQLRGAAKGRVAAGAFSAVGTCAGSRGSRPLSGPGARRRCTPRSTTGRRSRSWSRPTRRSIAGRPGNGASRGISATDRRTTRTASGNLRFDELAGEPVPGLAPHPDVVLAVHVQHEARSAELRTERVPHVGGMQVHALRA